MPPNFRLCAQWKYPVIWFKICLIKYTQSRFFHFPFHENQFRKKQLWIFLYYLSRYIGRWQPFFRKHKLINWEEWSVWQILPKSKVSQNSSHQVSQFEILQGLIDQGRFVSPESSGGGSYLKVYRCCWTKSGQSSK